MNENKNQNPAEIIRWLKCLSYISLASILNSVISLVPGVSGTLTSTVSTGVAAAVIFCMFQLAPANGRYQKAAIFRLIMLGCSLNASFLLPLVLTLLGSVFSWLAVYQEYSGHSELIADQDGKLSGKWHSLFNWNFLIGVLGAAASFAAAMIASMLPENAGKLIAAVSVLLCIVQLVYQAVYIYYLTRTVSVINGKGGANGYDI